MKSWAYWLEFPPSDDMRPVVDKTLAAGRSGLVSADKTLVAGRRSLGWVSKPDYR